MRERSRPYTGQAMTPRTLWLALVLGASVAAVAPPVAMALGDTTGAPCAVTAGSGTASNNTITCNFGLTPEQLRQVSKAAVEDATAPLIDRIASISKTLGVTEEAAKTLLRIIGEQPDVPDERLGEVLTKVASDYKRLQAQVAALNPDNPAARNLVDRARSEIAAGHFAAAHQLLSEARQAQIAAAQEANKLAAQAQAARDAQLLGAAASAAAEGDLAMTELHYAQVADLFKQAAELVPAGHPDRQEIIFRVKLSRFIGRATSEATTLPSDNRSKFGISFSKSGPSRGCRSTGRRHSTTSASRSLGLASERAGGGGWRRRSPPSARRWRNGHASGCRSSGR